MACGPAAGSAVHELLQAASPESPPEVVAAASEGIKAFAAALAVADGDGPKAAVLLVLLPLLIGAAAPASGRPAPALQTLAVTLITRLAGAAPTPFKSAVGGAHAPDAHTLCGNDIAVSGVSSVWAGEHKEE